MSFDKLPCKLLISDKKNTIFLDKLADEGYEIISYEKYLLEFIDELFDIICINNKICVNYRNSLNQFQISELISIVNKYFGKYCIEKSIISKNVDKKIVIYDIYHEDVREFFKKCNFRELEFN